MRIYGIETLEKYSEFSNVHAWKTNEIFNINCQFKINDVNRTCLSFNGGLPKLTTTVLQKKRYQGKMSSNIFSWLNKGLHLNMWIVLFIKDIMDMLKKLVPTVVILIWLADKMDNTGMFDSTKQVVPLNLLNF